MERYNVLFLCTGNSARSIMAEALLNYWGRGRFRAFSAGSQPKGEVHPIDPGGAASARTCPGEGAPQQELERVLKPGAPELDFIFTVCGNAAKEECPYWPGQPMTAHWGVEDPAAVEGTGEEQAPRLQPGAAGAGGSNQAVHRACPSSPWTRWRCRSGSIRSVAFPVRALTSDKSLSPTRSRSPGLVPAACCDRWLGDHGRAPGGGERGARPSL